MATELAVGYVNVLPEVDGFSRSLSQKLAGLGEQVGRDIGADISAGISDGAEQGGREGGGRLAAALKGGLVGVTVAVGAAITEGFRQAVEQRDTGAALAARLGLSEVGAANFGESAGRVYADNFGDSIAEVGNALDAVFSTFGDVGQADLENMTEQALTLAETFGFDVAEAASTAGTAVRNGLAGNGEEAFDLLFAAAQRTPAQLRSELLPALEEYGTFIASLGFTGEEAFGLMAEAASDGLYGLDKTGDALKELTIRATDMSATSVAAYEAAGLNAEDMAARFVAGGDTAKGALDDLVEGLLGIEDPVARSNAAIGLFGTPLEDLNVTEIPEFLASLTDVDSGLGSVAGTADRAAQALAEGPSAKIEAFKREVLGGLTNFIGDAVIPRLDGLKDAAAEVGSVLFRGDFTGQGPWSEDSPFISGLFTVRDTILGVVDRIRGVDWAGAWEAVSGPAVAAFDTAKGLVGPVVEEVAGLAGTLRDTGWDGLWAAVTEPVADAFDAVVDYLAPVLDPVVEAIQDTAEAVSRIDWAQIGGAILDGLGAAVEFVRGIDFAAIFQGIFDFARPMIDALGQMTDAVIALARPIYDLLVAALNAAMPLLKAMWPIVKAVGIAFGAVAFIMSRYVILQLKALAAVVSWVAEKVLPAMTWVIENVWTPVFSFIAGYISTVLIPVWSWLAAAVVDAVGWIADKVTEWWGVLQPIFTAVVGFIRDHLLRQFEMFRDVVVWVWPLVQKAIEDAWAIIKPIFEGIISTIAVVAQFISDRVDDITGYWDTLKSAAEEVFGTIADAIQGPFETAFNAIKDLWNDTLGGFSVPEVRIPGVGTVGGFTIPEMHTGGIVPGRPGEEVLRKLEGGELVVDRHTTADLLRGPTSREREPGAGLQVNFHNATTTAEVAADLWWAIQRAS